MISHGAGGELSLPEHLAGSKDIFHEYANDFAKKVNDMAGGRLKIEVLPSGSAWCRPSSCWTR